MQSNGVRWILLSREISLIALADGDTAAFNHAYSDSFVFNSLDLALYRALESCPDEGLVCSDLAESVRSDLGLSEFENLESYTVQFLAQLEEIGIAGKVEERASI
jgi:hypothetical protein